MNTQMQNVLVVLRLPFPHLERRNGFTSPEILRPWRPCPPQSLQPIDKIRFVLPCFFQAYPKPVYFHCNAIGILDYMVLCGYTQERRALSYVVWCSAASLTSTHWITVASLSVATKNVSKRGRMFSVGQKCPWLRISALNKDHTYFFSLSNNMPWFILQYN